MHSDLSEKRTDRYLILVLALAVTATVAIFAAHAWCYFFIFDDFALVGVAAERPLSNLFLEPQFGFFRPLAFVVTKAQYMSAGWSAPWLYSAGSLLIHALNAALVWAYARAQRLPHAGAVLAGVLFLMSPWAGETYFWVSGRFDLLATAGVLGSLLLGLASLRTHDPARSVAAAICGWLAGAVALLAKESAAVLPVLMAASILAADGPPRPSRRRTLGYLGGLSIVVAAYLLARERLLPGLTGAYGALSVSFQSARPAENLWSFIRGLLLPPFGARPASDIGAALLLAAILLAVCITGRRRGRLAVVAGGCVIVALAPVLWTGMVAGSSAGGRFLYLPGVWFVLVVAAGAETIASRTRALVVSIVLLAAAGSVLHQAAIWKEAAFLSREAVTQVGAAMGASPKIFVTNMPSVFLEGPYVLKEYAFRLHPLGRGAQVRARRIALKYERGTARFAGWLDDPGSESAVPATGEQVLTLQLPIRGFPRPPKPAGGIETPAAGTLAGSTFAIAGWAIDRNARDTTGVTTVHIYAYPDFGSGKPPVMLGVARYGEPSPRVAEAEGPQFSRSGFSLDVFHLDPGEYLIAAMPLYTAANAFTGTLTVNVTVR